MAVSSQRYPVVGSPLAFLDLNIKYFDRSEISVYIDDVIQAKGTTWNWFGTTEKRIVFSPSVAIGLEVLIKRTTDLTKIRHSYTQGAAFTAGTLDEDLNQVLHIAQEAVETPLAAAAAALSAATAATTAASIATAAVAAMYPVGALYISTLSANPATLFGFGTWITFAAGRALVSLDVANPMMGGVEAIFGRADTVLPNHTHTINDPGHAHWYYHGQGLALGGAAEGWGGGYIGGYPTLASYTGISINSSGDSPMNQNYQPSVAVYMWKRIA